MILGFYFYKENKLFIKKKEIQEKFLNKS